MKTLETWFWASHLIHFRVTLIDIFISLLLPRTSYDILWQDNFRTRTWSTCPSYRTSYGRRGHKNALNWRRIVQKSRKKIIPSTETEFIWSSIMCLIVKKGPFRPSLCEGKIKKGFFRVQAFSWKWGDPFRHGLTLFGFAESNFASWN